MLQVQLKFKSANFMNRPSTRTTQLKLRLNYESTIESYFVGETCTVLALNALLGRATLPTILLTGEDPKITCRAPPIVFIVFISGCIYNLIRFGFAIAIPIAILTLIF